MSYIDVRDNIHLYEYWQLLAVAIDTDEKADFNFANLVAIAVNDPKKIKRLKPSAGSVAVKPQDFLAGMAMAMTGGKVAPMGTAEDYARATGRRIVYVTIEGYVDEAGNPTMRERGDLVLQKPTVVN